MKGEAKERVKVHMDQPVQNTKCRLETQYVHIVSVAPLSVLREI